MVKTNKKRLLSVMMNDEDDEFDFFLSNKSNKSSLKFHSCSPMSTDCDSDLESTVFNYSSSDDSSIFSSSDMDNYDDEPLQEPKRKKLKVNINETKPPQQTLTNQEKANLLISGYIR
eukprot:268917_1